MKGFKAQVKQQGEIEEVTIYAVDIDDALEKAERAFGPQNVTRVRTMVAPDVNWEVTQ
ncbi:hypothetical protein PspYZU08_18 [Pseudomonas phage PspYZU08]|uniref:Uncharacterized protein n=1 Tax=Pseudomonas phage PspYZU08 TaxID=1983557 RepID=A0A2U7NJP5_9CAUD|nr:RNA polymerase inhibitor [Pseudomonas phage PspYZU08]ASD52194.1 hypothetical protein PspYZU08_18 [Pseudomonas phage PspYZU08]